MFKITSLLPDDRDWINGLIDSLTAGKVSISNTEVTDELILLVRRKEEGGDKQAERVIKALATDGVRRQVEARIKDDVTCVRLSQSGEVVQLPTRVGVRKRTTEGVVEPAFQQTLWYTLPWPVFIEMIRARQGQHDRNAVALEAFREILALREQYPDTLTPLEACDAAGIDPREFDLGEAQAS